MLKKQFVELIKPHLKENDKPFNRQFWNDCIDNLSREGGSLNIKKAQYWVKVPKKYYGEK